MTNTANLANLPIQIDDLRCAAVATFLGEHLEDMRRISPPESVHALDISGLQQPEITFYSIYHDAAVIGTAAVKDLGNETGEIKSMRTSANYRGCGLGQRLLEHVIHTAQSRGYTRLYLETGSMAFFYPAHRLYLRNGFVDCPPFGQYQADPNSRFMILSLT